MPTFDAPVVLEQLEALYWIPERETDIPRPIQEALNKHSWMARHPAVAALQNLSGLRIGKVGQGQECATSDIVFEWNEPDFTGQYQDRGLRVWEKWLDTQLIQLAEVHHAHSQLLMASDGRCFSWSFIGIRYEGDNLQQALEHLLLGIRSRPMLGPGQSSIIFYGRKYQAGDPEIYRY